jgi:hypothetical protein
MLGFRGATNATLYASSNLTGMLAQEGLFPSFFGAGSRPGAKARPDRSQARSRAGVESGNKASLASVRLGRAPLDISATWREGFRRRRLVDGEEATEHEDRPLTDENAGRHQRESHDEERPAGGTDRSCMPVRQLKASQHSADGGGDDNEETPPLYFNHSNRGDNDYRQISY